MKSLPSVRYLLLAVLFPLLLSCGRPGPPPEGEIHDLRLLPQDLTAYLDPARSDLPLFEDPEALAADALARHFAPWEKGFPVRPRSEAFWILPWLQGKTLYGENRRPLEPARLQEAVALADAERFPGCDRPGITVRPAALRALPGGRPWFLGEDRPGEGFPFDYLQNSTIPAATPLRIRHRSTDGAWFFVETAALHGWAPATEIALVDEDFTRRFRQPALVALVQEPVPVTDVAGVFRFTGGIGTLLPSAGMEPGGVRVLTAAADAEGKAVLRPALLPAGAALPYPVPATPANVATIGNRLLGQPYGWGGLYGNRDCSATLRDLFAPFGLWLPRNSSGQARAGRSIPLEGLPADVKEKTILAGALPWRTLLNMPGHVALYVGEDRGRAIVLQSIWGLRTREGEGRQGRRVIGRTVITTLHPGQELENLLRPEGDLLHRVRSMSVLGEPALPK